MNDKKRIEEIISDLKISLADFARVVRPNARVQWVYDITNEKPTGAGKPVGISKEVAKLIVDAYPQYNISWVCFGIGTKFNEVKSKNKDNALANLEELYILQRETLARVHVLQEFQVWLAKETHKIPEKKIFGKLDSIRRDYEESLK